MSIKARLKTLERRSGKNALPLILIRGFSGDGATSDGIRAASIIGRQPPKLFRRDFDSDEAFWATVRKAHERMHGPASLTVTVPERRAQ